MLEMIAAGLDARCEMTIDDATDAQKLQWRRDSA